MKEPISLDTAHAHLHREIDKLDPLDAWTLIEVLERYSVTEIIQGLEPLEDEEVTESELAEIDKGIWSAQNEPLLTSDEVRAKIKARLGR